jgi:N utilization substance protein B
MTRPDPAAKRRAREAALQMLYQWEIGRMGANETVATYWPARDDDAEAGPLDQELRAFANDLVTSTIARVQEIDGLIAPRAHNWRVARMAAVDRLVLRLAVCELLTAPATPAKVIINEALELARRYSGDEAVAFVNGILDAVRKDLNRP